MNDENDLGALLAPVWRRKWLVLAVAVIVAAATYVYYHRQTHLYSATTQLDLGSGSEAQLADSQSKANLNSRALADAAALIASSDVAEAVRARLLAEHLPTHLGKVRAKAAAESYFVAITAEAHSPKATARLANYYAQAYIERQHARYKSEVQAAIASTRRQLRRIEAAQAASLSAARRTSAGKGNGSNSAKASSVGGSAVIEAASLASKINQLESDLSVASVQQVDVAKPADAKLVSPTPTRNAIFGFVLALLLGSLAVLGVGRLDRRIRSLSTLEAIFKARLLALLPKQDAPIDYRDGSPKPAEALLEPLRHLHTSIQLADVLEAGGRRSPRSILFVSPGMGDGKSTLVADLALTQCEAGARVAVLEADLRRPAQAGLLSVSSSLGLTEVLTGAAPLDQALQGVGALPVVAPAEAERQMTSVSTIVRTVPTGTLSVLVSGRPVANPPALLASEGMRELLQSASAGYDYVLIDAPPPLLVSDAMPLLHWVDGIVIVARMDHTSQASARQLARLLAETSTAPVLGLVAGAVSRTDMKRGGFGVGYGERP